GLARSAAFEHHGADTKFPVTQGMEVDARYDKVAAHGVGAHFGYTQDSSDRLEMLRLNERDLALAVGFRRVVVSCQTIPRNCFDFRHRDNQRAPRRSYADPFQFPRARKLRHQFRQFAVWIHLPLGFPTISSARTHWS